MLQLLVKSGWVLLCLFCLMDTQPLGFADVSSNRKPSPKGRRMNSLVKYIAEKAAKHQVMILTDQESTNHSLKINDFVQKIICHVPTLVTTIEAENSFTIDRHVGRKPRETTLFVILSFSEAENLTSDLEKPVALLSKLSHQYTRPKCVIVHFSKDRETNYKTLLMGLWKRQFLDVTVLQLENSKPNLTNRFAKRVSTLHQFNPFSQIYTSEKGRTSSWFPDKGFNLYNQTLKVFFIRRFERFDIFHGEMSKSLHFSLQFVNDSKIKSGYDMREGEGLWYGAYAYFHTPIERRSHFGRVQHLVPIYVAVPKVHDNSFTENLLSWELFIAVIVNVLIAVALNGLLMLLKFDKDCWQILDIGGLILGLGLPNVPQRMRERIVLCGLLLMCMIYSGYFHSILTDVQFQPVKYKDINSLEDLAETDLSFWVTVRSLFEEMENKPEYIKKLLNRTILYNNPNLFEVCVHNLLTFKNTACSMEDYVLQRLTDKYRKLQKKLEMRVLEHSLSFRACAFIVEYGFSIMDNFDKKLLQFNEVGLMSKWKLYYSPLFPLPNDISNEVNESKAFIVRLLILLIFGYTLALGVFIGEIVWHYFAEKKKKLHVIELRKRKKRVFQKFFLRRKVKNVKVSSLRLAPLLKILTYYFSKKENLRANGPEKEKKSLLQKLILRYRVKKAK